MDLKNEKSELRLFIREEIDALPEQYIAESDRGIFEKVSSLPQYKNAQSIMLFYSVQREPDTLELSRVALRDGKTVSFPFCFRGGIMQARSITDLSQMRPAILGIPAPSEDAPIVSPEALDLIVVPALTFDIEGFRLGYGGGYYDRYLKDIPAYTVGIARHRLLRQKVPKEPHDIAVKCLVTEEEVFAQQR